MVAAITINDYIDIPPQSIDNTWTRWKLADLIDVAPVAYLRSLQVQLDTIAGGATKLTYYLCVNNGTTYNGEYKLTSPVEITIDLDADDATLGVVIDNIEKQVFNQRVCEQAQDIESDTDIDDIQIAMKLDAGTAEVIAGHLGGQVK